LGGGGGLGNKKRFKKGTVAVSGGGSDYRPEKREVREATTERQRSTKRRKSVLRRKKKTTRVSRDEHVA